MGKCWRDAIVLVLFVDGGVTDVSTSYVSIHQALALQNVRCHRFYLVA